MHFVAAKGILTRSGGHDGMNIYRGVLTAVFIATAGANAISLRMPLKTLRSSRMRLSCWKLRFVQGGKKA